MGSLVLGFLNLIILFLVVPEANAIIQIEPHSCLGFKQSMKDAIEEAIDMAEFAYQRQIGLRDGTLHPANMRVTMNTFQAFFTTFAGRNQVQPGWLGPDAAQAGDRLLGRSLF